MNHNIRQSWEKFIEKYPGLKHDGGIPPSQTIAQEAHAVGWADGSKATRDDLQAEINKLREALIWCSGSSDFAPGAMAREGFERVVLPLLT